MLYLLHLSQSGLDHRLNVGLCLPQMSLQKCKTYNNLNIMCWKLHKKARTDIKGLMASMENMLTEFSHFKNAKYRNIFLYLHKRKAGKKGLIWRLKDVDQQIKLFLTFILLLSFSMTTVSWRLWSLSVHFTHRGILSLLQYIVSGLLCFLQR